MLEALNTINGAIAAAVEEQSIVGWGRGGA
jgi:hypothetical protein